ncbi:TonB-dependent receptor [Mesoterricola silvestris]|uniref:TonB-dependent receptor n=1 Tax=Mesoterricola silvestris TaxID=2927979 RepID=A0AA48GQU6_9BACT|nr:TonB-dependent receptor [Mesoterricola silvestris]BDU72540.1 hypothetical protein METEAL_17140 [Mesoterricola silvestris]
MIRFPIRQLSLTALALIAAPAAAQESTGQVVGTVRTRTGEGLAGVKIRLSSPALQGVRTVVTEAKGAYRAPLLPPGSYRIDAIKEGYHTNSVTMDVGLGAVIRQDIVLGKVAEAGTTVEVIAATAAVDKTDVKSSTNITSEIMDIIPRTTRGMDTIALLTPGVTTNTLAGMRITMRGGQTTGNRFLLNGTDIADNMYGDTTGRFFYVDDSIAETQVIQSPVNARYGNFTGGVINAITKTGSNEFTGILRMNLSRNSWYAVSPRGLRPASAPINSGTGLSEDLRNASYTLIIGGPILKDRIWFSVSTKKDPQNSIAAALYSTQGLSTLFGEPAYQAPTNGQPYTRIGTLKFWEGKLTFGLGLNHTLEFTANKNETTQTNRSIGGEVEPAALYDSANKNTYWTLGYRGILSSSTTLEARYAVKKDSLGGGGRADAPFPQRIYVGYSNGGFYAFNNGAFKAGSPDERDIKTAIANLTWFSPATPIGTWTVDMGFEYLNQERSAPNEQSPTGNRIFLEGRNPDGTYRVTNWADDPDQINTMEIGVSATGVATTRTTGLYLNGTLAVNDKLQLMVGGRYDEVTAKDTLGAPNIKSSAWSPRLQATYDLWGDQAWLFRASFATYTGRLHDGFTNKFTFAGNPVREWYSWGAPSNYAATYADVTNLANWALNANGFQGVGGASGNFVQSNLKAPSVNEWSFDIKHAYPDGSYFKAAVVRRDWKNLYNDILTIGDETAYAPRAGTGIPPVGTVATRWITDPRLKREYTSLEFDFAARLSRELTLGGNYTYAVLRGNGEGGDSGGTNTGPVGDPLGTYDSVHYSRGRDTSYFAPMGYLNSDQRHRSSIHLDYLTRSQAGAAFNASLLFNYAGGECYSLTRTNAFEAQADAAAAGSPIVGQYPSTYNRYFGERGFGRMNDSFNFDLKLGIDVPVVSKVRYFLEVTVYNVFNHWQLTTVSTAQTTVSPAPATNSATAGFYASPWVVSASGNRTGFGTYGGDGTSNFTGGRWVMISTGIKW